MNNPTSAEREALTTRLRTAVPTEPDLWGLAARAESGARRNRTKRRTGVAAVAACGVAAVVVAPQVLGSHAAQPSFRSPSHGLPAYPCSGSPDHRDFTQGKAVWATFCTTNPPRTGVGGPAVTPQVLTKGVTGLVAAWQRASGTDHSCPWQPGLTPFEVRVGFADGTTTTVRGETGACPTALIPRQGALAGPAGARVYADLVDALKHQAGHGHPHDGASGPSTTPPGD